MYIFNHKFPFQSIICLLFVICSFSATANAAGLLARAKEKQRGANEMANDFMEKIDGLVKASVAAEVSGDIAVDRGNSGHSRLTVSAILAFNQDAWNLEIQKVGNVLKEISMESSMISLPFGIAPYTFHSVFNEKFPYNDGVTKRAFVFRGIAEDKKQSEWALYILDPDIWREFEKLFGRGYVLSMAITDDKGAALKSESRSGFAMPISIRNSCNLFLTPFFVGDGALDLGEHINTSMAGRNSPITVRFQSVIETEKLDKGDDIVFSIHRQ